MRQDSAHNVKRDTFPFPFSFPFSIPFPFPIPFPNPISNLNPTGAQANQSYVDAGEIGGDPRHRLVHVSLVRRQTVHCQWVKHQPTKDSNQQPVRNEVVVVVVVGTRTLDGTHKIYINVLLPTLVASRS